MKANNRKELLKKGLVVWLTIVVIAAFCGTIFGSFIISF